MLYVKTFVVMAASAVEIYEFALGERLDSLSTFLIMAWEP